MAVFGPQLIYTVIMFVLLSKLGKFYSIGRWLLCRNLYRYLSPNSEDIKKSVRNFYKSTTSKNKKLNRLFEIDEKKEEFNIPAGAEIEVACSEVKTQDLYYIKYTDDLQSFIDISFIALFIYATTEVYVAFVKPVDEVNLSIVWCGMAMCYGFLTLSSIAANYLRTDEGSLLYIFAGLSFMISMLVQLGDTKFFDFNLKDAFHNVTLNTLNLLEAHIAHINGTDIPDTQTKTKQFIFSKIKTYSTNDILFSCFIALISGFIGAILFFPSFRLARLHFLCLKHSSESKLMKFVFYLNFLMPLAVSLCWIKSGQSHENVVLNASNETMNITAEEKMTAQFLSAVLPNVSNTTNLTGIAHAQHSAKMFIYNFMMASNLKVYLIILMIIIRMFLYRHYAQSYLNVALELAYDLRQGTSRLTNTRYMQTISSIYQYYGVVASQYVIPLFCLLFLSLLLKTLGNLSWCGNSILCNDIVDSVSNYTGTLKSGFKGSPSILKQLESSNFNLTLSHNAINEIFSPYVLRSIFGYFTFWTASIWFVQCCIGLIYYQYINRQYN